MVDQTLTMTVTVNSLDGSLTGMMAINKKDVVGAATIVEVGTNVVAGTNADVANNVAGTLNRDVVATTVIVMKMTTIDNMVIAMMIEIEGGVSRWFAPAGGLDLSQIIIISTLLIIHLR